MESPLDDDDFDLEVWQAKKAQAYDERIIKFLITRLGLEEHIQEIRQQVKEVTGTPGLNREIFKDYFPSFPVNILPVRIPYLHQVTIADLYKRFTKTPVGKAISEYALDYIAESLHFALVFNWPDIGVMCLHNYYTYLGVCSDTCLVRRIQFEDTGVFLVLEKFTALIDLIKERWQP
jgi:hypothetical protein